MHHRRDEIQHQVHHQGVLKNHKDQCRRLPGGGVVPVHADVGKPNGVVEVRLVVEIKSIPPIEIELRFGLS